MIIVLKGRVEMKYSRQREALLRVLKSTRSHPTAYWVYEELKKEIPNISLGTVYRNLAQLTQNGDIIKLDVVSDKERFDAFTAQHAHFVCSRCGEVLDAQTPDFEELCNKTEQKLGCSIESRSLTFYGTCSSCKKSEKEII